MRRGFVHALNNAVLLDSIVPDETLPFDSHGLGRRWASLVA